MTLMDAAGMRTWQMAWFAFSRRGANDRRHGGFIFDDGARSGSCASVPASAYRQQANNAGPAK